MDKMLTIKPDDEQQRLQAIGWQANTSAITVPPDRRLARVIAQHRNGYRLHDGVNEFNAQPAPRFLRRSADPEARPAVGDFVLIAAAAPPLIEQVLPRRTVLSRAAAGERHVRQLIATNIDTVFVLMGLDGDFNPRRIERYLVLIQGSGAQPVVVLTKIDKVDASAAAAALAELGATLPGLNCTRSTPRTRSVSRRCLHIRAWALPPSRRLPLARASPRSPTRSSESNASRPLRCARPTAAAAIQPRIAP